MGDIIATLLETAWETAKMPIVALGILTLIISYLGPIFINIAITVANEILAPEFFEFDFNIFPDILINGVNTSEITGEPWLIQLMSTIGLALVVLLTISSVVKAMAASVTGDKTDPPLRVIIKAIIAILVIVFYPKILNTISSLMKAFASMFYYDMTDLQKSMTAFVENMAQGINGVLVSTGTTLKGAAALLVGNPYIYIVFVFGAALISGVITASITYIERYLSFLVYLALGPICISLSISSNMSETFKEWIKGVISQIISIFICMLCYKLFLAEIRGAFTFETVSDLAIDYVDLGVSLALLAFVKNSEKFANLLGFRTMANREAAMDFGRGMKDVFGGMSRDLQMATKRNALKTLDTLQAKNKAISNAKERYMGSTDKAGIVARNALEKARKGEKGPEGKGVNQPASREELYNRAIKSVADNQNLSPEVRKSAIGGLNRMKQESVAAGNRIADVLSPIRENGVAGDRVKVNRDDFNKAFSLDGTGVAFSGSIDHSATDKGKNYDPKSLDIAYKGNGEFEVLNANIGFKSGEQLENYKNKVFSIDPSDGKENNLEQGVWSSIPDYPQAYKENMLRSGEVRNADGETYIPESDNYIEQFVEQAAAHAYFNEKEEIENMDFVNPESPDKFNGFTSKDVEIIEESMTQNTENKDNANNGEDNTIDGIEVL